MTAGEGSVGKGVQQPAKAESHDQKCQEGPDGVADAFAGAALREQSEGRRYRQREDRHGFKMVENHDPGAAAGPSSLDPKPICSTSRTHRKFKTPALANRRVP